MNNNNLINHPEEDHDSDLLDLSLCLRRPSPPRRPSSAPPLSQPQTIPSQIPVYSEQIQPLYYPNPVFRIPSEYPLYVVPPEVLVARSPTTSPTMNLNINESPMGRGRGRRNPPRNNGEDPNRAIQPPYPWSTSRPAVVHELVHLVRNLQIETVTGMVRCNKCDKEYEIRFNIEQKMDEFWGFVLSKKGNMHDRAAVEWMSPPSMKCRYCSGDGAKPVIDENKDNINWLFLFLGQMLGYCTLEQLKYFCACTNNHRTGAKDRVLYLTYREIFRQLLPNRPQIPW